MTRSGSRPPRSRQVSAGSSAITVPAPTITASISLRQSCTSRRAAAPVIQREAPRAGGDAAVERGRQLQRDQRPAACDDAGEAGEELGARCRLDAGVDRRRRRGAGAPRRRRARAGSGSRHAEDDAPHAGGQHGLGTRRRAAVMVAGLERHVERRAARARVPASRSASTSACGSPARLVIAAADDRPPATTTAPTGGVGARAAETAAARGAGPAA